MIVDYPLLSLSFLRLQVFPMLSRPRSLFALPASLGRLHPGWRESSSRHGILTHEIAQKEHSQRTIRGCHEITQRSTSQCKRTSVYSH